MSITAKSNYGSKIYLKAATGETFEQIEGVYNIPDIEDTEEQIDVTHHGSGPYREKIPSGLSDPGEYVFGMRVDTTNAVQQRLRAMKAAKTKGTFKIEWPDGFTKVFNAYVSGIKRNDADASSPEGINADVTLAISGNVTEDDGEVS
ncbi:MAG: hypothetical protein IJU38_07065 [Clostridia bacterium]|nr:hypothetical protein [Clostridia bacterium]